jgi:hypothetical protein
VIAHLQYFNILLNSMPRLKVDLGLCYVDAAKIGRERQTTSLEQTHLLLPYHNFIQSLGIRTTIQPLVVLQLLDPFVKFIP